MIYVRFEDRKAEHGHEGQRYRRVGPFRQVAVRTHPTVMDLTIDPNCYALSLRADGKEIAAFNDIGGWWEDTEGIIWPAFAVVPAPKGAHRG